MHSTRVYFARHLNGQTANSAVYVLAALVLTVMLLAACAPSETPTPRLAPATATQPPQSASQPSQPTAQPTQPTAARAAAVTPTNNGETLQFRIDPDRSEARYRVREQLAGRDLPNDAVGATKQIDGILILKSDGTFAEGSKVTVNLTTLQSDQSRRDNFISRNTLQTATFPNAEFVPVEIKGLSQPLPTSGPATFQLVGRLKIRDVEKSVIWDVDGTVADDMFTGKATTQFTFGDFGMTQPKVALVLSIVDNIRLELDVVAVRVRA